MIKTIQPFIDLNWYTVPLKGQLKRLQDGKKTIPIYPENWKEYYTNNFNKNPSALGGVITGELSKIVAIDCDNEATYQMFKALDPDYKFHFMSKGKISAEGIESKCGTIIYSHIPELNDSYALRNNFIALDFLSSERFAYLPTQANETKHDFEFCELKEPPLAVIALIKSLQPVKVEAITTANKTWRNHLAPQIKHFIATKKVTPELFRILTPKDFRDTPEYLAKTWLHPDSVPDGRGSEYLVKVSAILGADESIDVDTYTQAMRTLNDMFSKPMPTTRLNSTIIEPMAEGNATINGAPIWQYNEQWEEDKVSILTKRNTVIEGFYDPDRLKYYAVNVSEEDVKVFDRDSEYFSYLDTVAIEPPSKKEFKIRLPLVNAISKPSEPFGFFSNNEGQSVFNTFAPTLALSIFREPSIYKDKYSRPNTILAFLQTLIPDNYMRNYLLRFLKRKLTTFEYSPTIIYLLGVSGAGKDTFVSIVKSLIGMNAVAQPSTKEFLEVYNGWMLDKYFVQLDEYGNQLVKFDDREIALGKIKAYTGKPEVQIRKMRNDGYTHIHHITFCMTANKNPLFFDDDDRRIALFNTPNKLADADWVIRTGGISVVINKIEHEINDFAYYLATEVDMLSKDEYVCPPDTEDKRILIASKYNASNKIAYLLKACLFVEFEKLAIEFDCLQVLEWAPEGRIYEEDLMDLYMEMTDSNGTKRGLSSAMKDFDKIPTTYKGAKAYYYNMPRLKGFKRSVVQSIKEEVKSDVRFE
jgi:hypothetical protein